MSLRQFIPLSVRSFQRRVRDRLMPNRWSGPSGFDGAGHGLDPSGRAASERAAEALFEARQKDEPLGTIGRSRLLLRIIEDNFPTQRLSEEYFQNMELLLRRKPRRSSPGKVLIGLGSGRSGSTSLTALLGTIDDSCCTHENPPLIGWTPDATEIEFHVRRFRLLADHWSVVADVAHWWLNALDGFFEHFPEGKAVGLVRDAEKCAKSFMRIKGFGQGSINHWAPSGNGVWRPDVWDRTYPSYSVPDYAAARPDTAKYEMIMRYVVDYNSRLEARAARDPERILLVRTEALSDPLVQAQILRLVGASGKPFRRKLNVRAVEEGMSEEFTF